MVLQSNGSLLGSSALLFTPTENGVAVRRALLRGNRVEFAGNAVPFEALKAASRGSKSRELWFRTYSDPSIQVYDWPGEKPVLRPATLPKAEFFDVSDDGKFLCYSRGSELRFRNLTTGVDTKIAAKARGPVVLGLSLSPDNSKIAYWTPGSQSFHPGSDPYADLWIKDLKTGKDQRVGIGKGACWSKDGKYVAALAGAERNAAAWQMIRYDVRTLRRKILLERLSIASFTGLCIGRRGNSLMVYDREWNDGNSPAIRELDWNGKQLTRYLMPSSFKGTAVWLMEWNTK